MDDKSNHIDKIYYINLAHRTDRNEQFKSWLAETGVPTEKIERIDALYVPGRGHLGATASHVKALETFLASDAAVCCIFEDDYEPIDTNTYWSSIQQVFDCDVEFDIVLLAYNVLESTPTQYPFLERAQNSYTASGYMITREFAPRLLENFKNAFRLAVEEESQRRQKTHKYCLDVYWAELMTTSANWFVLKPRIGKQSASYSDIEGILVDHGV
jgi:hypothetical protein